MLKKEEILIRYEEISFQKNFCNNQGCANYYVKHKSMQRWEEINMSKKWTSDERQPPISCVFKYKDTDT